MSARSRISCSVVMDTMLPRRRTALRCSITKACGRLCWENEAGWAPMNSLGGDKEGRLRSGTEGRGDTAGGDIAGDVTAEEGVGSSEIVVAESIELMLSVGWCLR